MEVEVLEAYKASWLGLNEDQQKKLCKRFSIEYTNREDGKLIEQISIRQQQTYDALKLANSILKKKRLKMGKG
jgi:hypothetical protein